MTAEHDEARNTIDDGRHNFCETCGEERLGVNFCPVCGDCVVDDDLLDAETTGPGGRER